MFKNILYYSKACYEELVCKTTWPTRAELIHRAMIVLSASLIIAVVVFSMDFIIQHLMAFVYPS
ncbi:preprotein translocase subunit SecE [Prevotella micans]|uniref:preprotein translocase subunit SecE n=1 Tax=Prevotella micans TaxID=189723 RepID=UPI0009DA20BB